MHVSLNFRFFFFGLFVGILNNVSNYGRSTADQNGVFVFQFDWSSIAKCSHNDMTKGVIRAHLRALPTWRPANATESVTVTVNVSVSILDDDDSVVPAAGSGRARITVVSNYSEWIEIDITAELKVVWDSCNTSIVVVSLQLASEDGDEAESVPAEIINSLVALPSSNSGGGRKSHTASLQPLLLLYLEDTSLKTRAMLFSSGPAVVGATLNDASRSRRAALPGSCDLYNYTVNFSDVGIDFVLVPESLNVGGCSGGCASSYQRSMPLGTFTNHASVAAAANAVQSDAGSSGGKGLATCCSPLKYRPVLLLVVNSDNILRVQLFTDMVVSACGCG